MPRPIVTYGIAALSILIIIGGFFGWTLVNSQNQSPSTTSSPSAKPNTSGIPENYPLDTLAPENSPIDTLPEDNPSATPLTIEQIRDAAITYIQINHLEIASLMTGFSWTGGRKSTGLIGAESYGFTSGSWTVSLKYPVILNPVYTITANYSVGTVYWAGTYENGIIKETTFFIANGVQLGSGQEQARDAAITYIKANHAQTAPLITGLEWEGGREDTGLLVSEKYDYYRGGWTVTVSYPVEPNPTYTITADYSSEETTVSWIGTYKNGTIKETSYAAEFPTPTPTAPPIPTLSPTPSPSPTPALTPTPTPTPTSQPTQTPTPTPSPTPTPTPTRTPTPTPTPTRTPTPTPVPPPTPAQIRTQIMNFTRTNHNQTTPYMQNTTTWTGGRTTPNGTVGQETFSFTSGGWNVTMQYPTVPNPLYTITANYNGSVSAGTPQHLIIAWAGTWQSGIIRETFYAYTP